MCFSHTLFASFFQEGVEAMSWISALITLAFGVVMPTVDVYSDIYLAVKLLTFAPPPGYEQYDWCTRQIADHQKYAAAMLTPPIISWIFVAYQWQNIEVGAKRKLATLPLLLLQVYPQWRALRVLYYGKWKKQRGWQGMKEEWETEICNLGECTQYGV